MDFVLFYKKGGREKGRWDEVKWTKDTKKRR